MKNGITAGHLCGSHHSMKTPTNSHNFRSIAFILRKIVIEMQLLTVCLYQIISNGSLTYWLISLRPVDRVSFSLQAQAAEKSTH